VKDFVKCVSSDFVLAAKELAKRGVGLAIATASDLAEHSSWKPRDAYILGDDLVHEMLREAVPEHTFFSLLHTIRMLARQRTQMINTRNGTSAQLHRSTTSNLVIVCCSTMT